MESPFSPSTWTPSGPTPGFLSETQERSNKVNLRDPIRMNSTPEPESEWEITLSKTGNQIGMSRTDRLNHPFTGCGPISGAELQRSRGGARVREG